jgi:hypothetical protein
MAFDQKYVARPKVSIWTCSPGRKYCRGIAEWATAGCGLFNFSRSPNPYIYYVQSGLSGEAAGVAFEAV